jgi:hypothetical protein
MMKLLLALTLTLAVFLPRAQAVADTLPFLTTFRAEVANQLTVVSNNIAATNDVRGNTRLKKTLIGALRTIDRTRTNSYVAGASALNVLNRTFYRTSLSNTFNPLVDQTRDVYVASLLQAHANYAARVNASYPGRAQTAALTSLARLLAAIDTANTNTNVLVALRFLSTSAKTETATQRATVKAEAAPAPIASITANVSGAINTTIKTTGAGITPGSPGNYTVLGSQFTLRPIGQRIVRFSLYGLTDGTHTVTLDDGGIVISAGFNTTTYEGNPGTATVTYNSASKVMFGTFTFTAFDDDNNASTITVTGSFSGTTL